MESNAQVMAYHQGISDWLRYHKRCPVYYRGTELEAIWKQGFDYAARWNQNERI